jgi:hypothetical protein
MACGCNKNKNPTSQSINNEDLIKKNQEAAKFRMNVIKERQDTCKSCEFSTKTEIRPGVFAIGKDSKCLKNNQLLMPRIINPTLKCPEEKWTN